MRSQKLQSALLCSLVLGGVLPSATATPINTLFGVDATTDQLIRIDTSTGAGVAVGPIGNAGIVGMAYDPTTDTLYGAGGRLYTVDRATGAATPVGGPSGFSVAGLAAHPVSGELFGVDSIADVLLAINKATGEATVIGALGGGTAFANVTGLAFNPTGDTLYGVENGNDQLVTIDPATGAATGVGSAFTVGGRVVTAIAFDPTSGDLFGSDAAGVSVSRLVSINPLTGDGVAVGAIGFDLVEALAFAPAIPEPTTGVLGLVAFAACSPRVRSGRGGDPDRPTHRGGDDLRGVGTD